MTTMLILVAIAAVCVLNVLSAARVLRFDDEDGEDAVRVVS